MPKFYFPIIDGTRLDDPEGVELTNAEAAREHAKLIASHMPKTRARKIAVIDDQGAVLHHVQVDKQD